ncbi:hypothetical protein [Brumimicrobium sp.]|uniref:hypothetical protein n=1 Tax=Brumimicrobium sp. TaxID=2029867 RepID=UPI003A91496B
MTGILHRNKATIISISSYTATAQTMTAEEFLDTDQIISLKTNSQYLVNLPGTEEN